MQTRKIVKFSIRGIPILPLMLMAVVSVGAVLVASRSVSNTLTISSAFSIQLFTFTGGVCTATVFSSYSFGTVAGQTAGSFNSTAFCIKNTSNAPVFIGGSQAYTIGSGTPTGSTVRVVVLGGTDFKTVTNFSLAAGSTYQGTIGLAIDLQLAGTEPAGSYSWSSTVSAYDVSTP